MAGEALPPPRKMSLGRAHEVNRLERELRETIERYELIFKATSDVLYDLNIQTGKVIWNKALYSQYGYSKTEPTGTLEWWVQHIHPEDALRVEDAMYQWLTSNKN